MTINVQGFQWQWSFTYDGLQGPRGHPLTITGQSGHPGDGDVRQADAGPRAEQAGPFQPDLERRDPLVLHPGVPVQARRDPGPSERVRPHADPGGHVLREVRGAVRARPLDDAVHREDHAARPVRSTWVQQRDPDPAAPGVGQGEQLRERRRDGKLTVVAKNIAFDTCLHRGAGGGHHRARVRQPGPGVPHNIEIYTDPTGDRRGWRARPSPATWSRAPRRPRTTITGLAAGHVLLPVRHPPDADGRERSR